MKIVSETSSKWMVELDTQMVRCKQVLLYGNIADQFLLNERYCTLAQFLSDYFVDEGYQIVGQYDIVDGFRFAKPAMFDAFDGIVRESLKAGPQAAPMLPGAPDSELDSVRVVADPAGKRAPDASPPLATSAATAVATPRRRPGELVQAKAGNSATPAVAASPATPTEQAARAYLELNDALQAMRYVLAQPQHSAAMVLHFGDKLVGSVQQQNEQERRWLIQLMKVMESAAYLRTPPLERRKNALVIVTRQLGAIPEWVHKDNPFLMLVRVSRPRAEERTSFARTFVRNFHDGAALTDAEVTEVERDFANLTDGFTAWDLDAILRTSVADKFPIRRTKSLIDYYMYGLRQDPWEKLDTPRIRESREVMERRVIGQPRAIEAVVDMLISARVGINCGQNNGAGGKPKGTFFFVGPTGVGKTELAKAVTALIFSDESAFARFDMSEYAEEHAAEKLTGAPPGFVGYEEGGQLTNRMRERPFSLLLFDEIEKAHGRIMDKFLQILEDGRLSDGKGQTAYFSQAAIIFTSNIGSDKLRTRHAGSGELVPYEEIRDHYLAAVRAHFVEKLGRPEILNRLGDNILVFDILRPEYIDGICQKFLNLLVAAVREKKQLELVFPGDEVTGMIRELMLVQDNIAFGGRRISSLLESLVERPLNRWFFFHDPQPGDTLGVTRAPGGQSICVNGKLVTSHG